MHVSYGGFHSLLLFFFTIHKTLKVIKNRDGRDGVGKTLGFRVTNA